MRKTTYAAIAITALCLVISGCRSRTPEERLKKSVELFQQGDTLGATLEARELIKKYPDDPRALEGRLLLSKIYYDERRPDDALSELDTVLSKVSQKDSRGREALKNYLAVLQEQKRFKDALSLIDKYQKEYADDEATSLNLTVARAHNLTMSGQTTASRALLSGLRDSTTAPAEVMLYHDMITSAYVADGSIDRGIEYLKTQYEDARESALKRELSVRIAMGYAKTENFEEMRRWLEEATQRYDAAIQDEIDPNKKAELALQIATWYDRIGNLPGARQVLQRLFQAPLNPNIVAQTINPLIDVLLRMGDVNEAIGVARQSAMRFPNSPFGQQAAQLETMKAQNMIDRMLPRDTSPLVMKFRQEPLLTLRNLPPPTRGTTDTLSAAEPTTGTDGTETPTTGTGTAETPATGTDGKVAAEPGKGEVGDKPEERKSPGASATQSTAPEHQTTNTDTSATAPR